MVVAAPNYATNIVTPRAIGADIELLELRFDDGYRLDLDRLAAMIRPDTAFVSLTCPHNPTGTMLTLDEIDAVIELVESRGTRLVLDETYRDMGRPEPLPDRRRTLAVGDQRVVDVEDLRHPRHPHRLGHDHRPRAAQTLLAAKEQIVICNSMIDEEIAFQVMRRRDERLPHIRAQIDAHREIVTRWIAGEPALEWVAPVGRRRLLPPHHRRLRRRRRAVLRGAQPQPRHLRRPRPLVRAAPRPLPPRLRLARHPRARAGPRRHLPRPRRRRHRPDPDHPDLADLRRRPTRRPGRRERTSTASTGTEGPASGSGALGVAEPALEEGGVAAAGGDQLVVGALLDQLAVGEHQHQVGGLGGRQAVGDADRGAALG